MISEENLNINLDSVGFYASFICAVHCVAVPILLTSISAAKLGVLANPLFEIMMIVLSVIIGFSSLLPSYKNHRKIMPIIILAIGFIGIFAGHFIVSENYESIVTPIGAFTVAFSHLVNWKINKETHSCLDHA